MPPVAAFSADDTSVCLNATVTFTDASTNTPNAWLWEFGDGNTSILQNPANTYYSLGQFTVNMRATNGDGFDWENKTNYITVNVCLPPTPTPTPVPYCSFVNMTNVTVAHNSTSWVLSSGATFWGMEIINESEGNVSYYTCGADTLVSGGGGTDSGGASIGAVFGIVGGLVGAILYIRKRRQEEEDGVS
jgi:PKD repeat protein